MAAKGGAKGKPDPKGPPPPEPEQEQEAFGTWENERNAEGLPHGEGKATYPNGDVYIGRMENNMREKRGKYIWKVPPDAKEGTHMGIYEGEYESNKKHGNGIMKYPDEGVYDGQWKEGMRDGKGTFQYPNGDWYKGDWLGGRKNGKGTYFSFNGSCWYSGDWSNGEFVEGDWKFKDGSCYKGAFKGGKPAPGPGVFKFPNGNEQKGRWVSVAVEGAEDPTATTVKWIGEHPLIIGAPPLPPSA